MCRNGGAVHVGTRSKFSPECSRPCIDWHVAFVETRIRVSRDEMDIPMSAQYRELPLTGGGDANMHLYIVTATT